MSVPIATDIVMNSISAIFVVLAAGFIAYMVTAILRSREADPVQRRFRDPWSLRTQPVQLRGPGLRAGHGSSYKRH
jgi:hypothetical protein